MVLCQAAESVHPPVRNPRGSFSYALPRAESCWRVDRGGHAV
jgi:hypothetical protein